MARNWNKICFQSICAIIFLCLPFSWMMPGSITGQCGDSLYWSFDTENRYLNIVMLLRNKNLRKKLSFLILSRNLVKMLLHKCLLYCDLSTKAKATQNRRMVYSIITTIFATSKASPICLFYGISYEHLHNSKKCCIFARNFHDRCNYTLE